MWHVLDVAPCRRILGRLQNNNVVRLVVGVRSQEGMRWSK